MNDRHASIDAAMNGFVLYLRKECEDKDEWHCQDTIICPTLEDAITKVKDYFHE